MPSLRWSRNIVTFSRCSADGRMRKRRARALPHHHGISEARYLHGQGWPHCMLFVASTLSSFFPSIWTHQYLALEHVNRSGHVSRYCSASRCRPVCLRIDLISGSRLRKLGREVMLASSDVISDTCHSNIMTSAKQQVNLTRRAAADGSSTPRMIPRY